MNSVVFILGVISAVVVILVAAVVVIMLKMKSIKKVEEEVYCRIEKESRNVVLSVDEVNKHIENLQENVYRSMEHLDKGVLSESKSYTDSRIDKIKN
jgi:t-SNARE complex subunit (syntaxin)